MRIRARAQESPGEVELVKFAWVLSRPRRCAARRGWIRRCHLRACRITPGVTRRRRRRRRSCCRTTTCAPSRRRSTAHGTDIACVITEAAAGNMGRSPAVDRVQRWRCAEITARHGALLIYGRGDDRIPVSPAGWRTGLRSGRCRPVHLRQGDERRTARGGVRRPGRRSWPIWPRPARCTRRGRCPEIPLPWPHGLATLRNCTSDVYERVGCQRRGRRPARRGCAVRGWRGPSGPVRGQPVLGVLRTESPVTNFAQAQAAGGVSVSAVLSHHAGRGRVTIAAQRIRSMVLVRGT